MSVERKLREISREQAMLEAATFRDGGDVLEAIIGGTSGVSAEPTIACGKLLRTMFPDREHFEALDVDAQQHFRHCAQLAIGRPLSGGIESLWSTMNKLWTLDGALFKPHQAKGPARVFAKKFYRELSAAIQRDLDDEMQDEAA